MIHQNDIRIKIRLLNKGGMLAQATVIFYDIIETHGWKVLRSNRFHSVFQEEIWIQAPSYQSSGKWREIIYINDKKTYELVQGKIYGAYCMARNKKEGLDSIKEENEEEKQNEPKSSKDLPF